MAKLTIRKQDLFENPTPRVPVCLVLDVSSSMSGSPIRELNRGVEAFFTSIRSDEIARYSAEISVVTFGKEVKRILDFEKIDRQDCPKLTAWGETPMGEAVSQALDLLETRKNEYSDAGVDYFQPWMVLMTDGSPTDRIDQAAQRTRDLVKNGKLTIFPIGVGQDVKLSVLKEFSPQREPLRLKGLNFANFFEWLSQSVSRVSQSMPGERIELEITGVKGWAVL